jgi:hypothetical protein
VRHASLISDQVLEPNSESRALTLSMHTHNDAQTPHAAFFPDVGASLWRVAELVESHNEEPAAIASQESNLIA